MKMRSFLFVPADSARKFDKARQSDADAIILDLEDSVAPDAKTRARQGLDALIETGQSGPQIWVRVNALGTGLTESDVRAATQKNTVGLILPKCESRDDLDRFGRMIAIAEAENNVPKGQVKIIALVTETPRAVFNLGTYSPAHPRLVGLTWGAEDLGTLVGAKANRDEAGDWTSPYQMVRNLCLMAAADAGVAAIDTVAVDFRDNAGLQRVCNAAARDGFHGKLAIHPAQIETINAAFTPTNEEIQTARAIVAAFEASPGTGTIGIDGHMYDRPHLKKALRLLAAL